MLPKEVTGGKIYSLKMRTEKSILSGFGNILISINFLFLKKGELVHEKENFISDNDFVCNF